MIELLNWISEHPGTSLGVGVFIFIFTFLLFEGIESIIKVGRK